MSDKILREIEVMDVVKGVGSAVIDAVVSVNPVSCFYWSVMKSSKENSLQRRHEIWQHEVGERLSKLEKTVFESLGNNENFVTTLLRTTELAIKTNGKKVECLANAVRYSAGHEVNEDYIVIFLNYIERYSISHLKLLKFFNAPNQYYTSIGVEHINTSPMTLYYETFSVPQNEYRLLETMAKQLFDDGLLNTREMNAGMTMRGALSQRTTDIGRKFIEFFGLNDVDL
jgi:hypothetical protein